VITVSIRYHPNHVAVLSGRFQVITVLTARVMATAMVLNSVRSKVITVAN
jgi:hypothetical protein